MEREKPSFIKGDEPGLAGKQGRSDLICARSTVKIASVERQDGAYVPTVGRWGNEWPS